MAAPEPIRAKFDEVEEVVDVTFSHELRWTNPLDVGNWTVLYESFRWTVTAAFCASSQVWLRLVKLRPWPLLNEVSFYPPPFDVVGQNGLPVQAFANYPLLPA